MRISNIFNVHMYNVVSWTPKQNEYTITVFSYKIYMYMCISIYMYTYVFLKLISKSWSTFKWRIRWNKVCTYYYYYYCPHVQRFTKKKTYTTLQIYISNDIQWFEWFRVSYFFNLDHPRFHLDVFLTFLYFLPF